MKASSRRQLAGLLLAVAALGFLSCNRKAVYSHYEHIPISGWERSDTLCFHIPPVTAAGTYHAELGLRSATTYPFMTLCLIVEQAGQPGPTPLIRHLTCNLIDRNGNMKGNGISHYQYSFRLGSLTLNKGDSLHFSVNHNMKREIIPGITDIGISLTKE